jgi:hypothetical protein
MKILGATVFASDIAADVTIGAWLSVWVLVASALCGVLWLKGAPTKVKPADACMEFRPEPPAVADLLTGGFVMEADAVTATAIDLAARGWYTIEGGGTDTIVRTRVRRPPDDELTSYEQQVLDHVEATARAGIVPIAALTIGPDGVTHEWFQRFRHEVNAHAQRLELCRPRCTATMQKLVFVSGLSVIVLGSAVLQFGDESHATALGTWLILLALFLAVALFAVTGRAWQRHHQTDTSAGVAASAHWLGVRDFYRNSTDFERKLAASVAIWDRHLAYATALGLSPAVERQLPFNAESTRRVWSHETGQWRSVNIRYATWNPGRGRRPLLAVGLHLFFTFNGGILVGGLTAALVRALRDDQIQLGLVWLASMGLMIIAVAVVCVLVHFVMLLADLFRARTAVGVVLRKCTIISHRLPPRLFVVIDDGSADTVEAIGISRRAFEQVSQGDRLSVQYRPWLRHVKSLESLDTCRSG